MSAELVEAIETGASEQPTRSQDPPQAAKPGLRPSRAVGARAVRGRWAALAVRREVQETLCPPAFLSRSARYHRSIENLIGEATLPLGLAGPLRIHGAQGCHDRYLPLATTEATLVASYARGAALITAAGGCRAAACAPRVQRGPGFVFETLGESQCFSAWATGNLHRFQEVAEATSNHLRLLSIEPRIDGNQVFLLLTFATGDAAGQNMVTFASEAVCVLMLETAPVRPRYWMLDANYSGDKKASALGLVVGRGRSATAEVPLPASLVRRHLHVSVARMVDYWRMSAVGGVLSGSLGTQGHYANGLAALFIATGQDPACVAESAIGVTRLEAREDGSLYASVTLPTLMVGSLGGGTALPTQRACLELMGVQGSGMATALAETAAALCLAGELSLIAAFAAGQFARAHRKCARGPRCQG